MRAAGTYVKGYGSGHETVSMGQKGVYYSAGAASREQSAAYRAHSRL